MSKIIKYFFLIVFCVGSFILVFSTNKDVFAASAYPFEGMINADSLVVRKTASSSSEQLTELAFGTRVTVNSESGSFYNVKYDKDKTGFVLKSYVLNVNEYASTSGNYRTYCDSLKAKGFLESYCPQLYYLHVAYPNWTFTPDLTGLTLEDASKKEEGKNVLQTGNSNYWVSNKPIEGNYYYVKANVVKSFMDPRNSMFPTLIFQYLDLESSKDIANEAAMLKISGSSGNLKNYFNEFRTAAVANGINPLHAMARSAQEGANKATYGAVTGTYTTTYGRTSEQGYSLDGYYNFYNIGSYASGYYSYPVQRGLAYAAGFLEKGDCFTKNDKNVFVYDSAKCGELSYQRPWNNQEKAIIGGVEFLAGTYVKKGQNTLYFQKFNVSSKHGFSLYTHQYMTNIMAPNSEGGTLYNAYKAGGLLNSKFNFIIPVYTDLGDDPAEPIDKNGDATLKEIKVNNNLVTGFDKDVLEYPLNVQTNENYINVTATPNYPLTTVVGTGKYNFVEGSVVVTLNTTAEDGTKLTYKITVKQIPVEEQEITVKDVTNKLKVKIDKAVMYGMSPGMTAQEMINSVTKANGTCTITNSKGTKKTSGKLATGDIITIGGTKENTKFTVAIRGDINGDAEVNLKDFVLVQSHILKKSTLKDIKFYAGDTNYDNNINLKDFVLVQSHILKKGSL